MLPHGQNMINRLLHLLLFAATAAASAPAAAADQSAQTAGAHELPAFVRDRVELTPGTADEHEPGASSDAAARPTRLTEGFVAR